jgi:outer membrane protein OmpA-like peptidoglycan-associated protein
LVVPEVPLDAPVTTAAEPATDIPPVLTTEVAPDGTEVVLAPDVPLVPTVLVDPVATPDVAPEAVENLGELLAAPTATADPAVIPEVVPAPVLEAAAIPLAPDATPPADVPAPVVLEQVLTEADTRSSAEEFAAVAAPEPGRRRDGLSDLEKVGLVALGAILVGAVLNNGNQVVDNTGDRVVVRDTAGKYFVYKDDDALLRRPGSNVRTETYRDGSTRTIVDRGDGTQVVTIRDATGRVLRRATFDQFGREIVLIDDLVEETRVDVTTLPPPNRARVTISTSDGDAELKAALARLQAEELGRTFSLRQIREIPQVRALAATVEVNAITFDSGSAAIRASEAAKLADLGGIINDLIAANPGEIFLIEGHTDAVGSASSNLTLSDRRAESVARALTEFFNVPPENLVVQGYGESELLIPTTGDERANRRVAVKVITPLMRTAALP